MLHRCIVAEFADGVIIIKPGSPNKDSSEGPFDSRKRRDVINRIGIISGVDVEAASFLPDQMSNGELLHGFSIRNEQLAGKHVAITCSGTDVTPNFHPVLIRASALLLPMRAYEARGCVA